MTEPFRILITGSRTWPDPDEVLMAIFDVIKANGHQQYIVVHGGAVGADSMASWAVEVLDKEGFLIEEEVHPANWSIGKAAGVLRNQQMVNLGADICLSFNHNNSNGTRHCTQAAGNADIPVRRFTI